MGNKFKEPESLILELKSRGMDATKWHYTSDPRWLVGIIILASNIDDIPTGDDREDRIYPICAPVPDNKALAHCFVWEDGETSITTISLDQYTKTRLSYETDTLAMLKIMAWDTKIRTKVSKIHDIIKELIKEEKDEQ